MTPALVRISALARVGFLQILRSRLYLNLIVAGIALVAAALLFDQLAMGEEGRMLVEIGLAFISLVVAVLAGTTGVVTVTREIESKTIHLVVARPMPRFELVVGRFFTLVALVALSNLILGAVLGLTAWGIGAEGGLRIVGASLFASFEGFIVAALALFFGVGSSSTVSALFVTTVFFVGRLLPLLGELIAKDRFGAIATPVLEVVYRVLPHFDRFDLTVWARTGRGLDLSELALSALYGVLYATMLLAFASFRIEKRDLL